MPNNKAQMTNEIQNPNDKLNSFELLSFDIDLTFEF
jgi:hypothetical protein